MISIQRIIATTLAATLLWHASEPRVWASTGSWSAPTGVRSNSIFSDQALTARLAGGFDGNARAIELRRGITRAEFLIGLSAPFWAFRSLWGQTAPDPGQTRVLQRQAALASDSALRDLWHTGTPTLDDAQRFQNILPRIVDSSPRVQSHWLKLQAALQHLLAMAAQNKTLGLRSDEMNRNPRFVLPDGVFRFDDVIGRASFQVEGPIRKVESLTPMDEKGFWKTLWKGLVKLTAEGGFQRSSESLVLKSYQSYYLATVDVRLAYADLEKQLEQDVTEAQKRWFEYLDAGLAVRQAELERTLHLQLIELLKKPLATGNGTASDRAALIDAQNRVSEMERKILAATSLRDKARLAWVASARWDIRREIAATAPTPLAPQFQVNMSLVSSLLRISNGPTITPTETQAYLTAVQDVAKPTSLPVDPFTPETRRLILGESFISPALASDPQWGLALAPIAAFLKQDDRSIADSVSASPIESRMRFEIQRLEEMIESLKLDKKPTWQFNVFLRFGLDFPAMINMNRQTPVITDRTDRLIDELRIRIQSLNTDIQNERNRQVEALLVAQADTRSAVQAAAIDAREWVRLMNQATRDMQGTSLKGSGGKVERVRGPYRNTLIQMERQRVTLERSLIQAQAAWENAQLLMQGRATLRSTLTQHLETVTQALDALVPATAPTTSEAVLEQRSLPADAAAPSVKKPDTNRKLPGFLRKTPKAVKQSLPLLVGMIVASAPAFSAPINMITLIGDASWNGHTFIGWASVFGALFLGLSIPRLKKQGFWNHKIVRQGLPFGVGLVTFFVAPVHWTVSALLGGITTSITWLLHPRMEGFHAPDSALYQLTGTLNRRDFLIQNLSRLGWAALGAFAFSRLFPFGARLAGTAKDNLTASAPSSNALGSEVFRAPIAYNAPPGESGFIREVRIPRQTDLPAGLRMVAWVGPQDGELRQRLDALRTRLQAIDRDLPNLQSLSASSDSAVILVESHAKPGSADAQIEETITALERALPLWDNATSQAALNRYTAPGGSGRSLLEERALDGLSTAIQAVNTTLAQASSRDESLAAPLRWVPGTTWPAVRTPVDDRTSLLITVQDVPNYTTFSVILDPQKTWSLATAQALALQDKPITLRFKQAINGKVISLPMKNILIGDPKELRGDFSKIMTNTATGGLPQFRLPLIVQWPDSVSSADRTAAYTLDGIYNEGALLDIELPAGTVVGLATLDASQAQDIQNDAAIAPLQTATANTDTEIRRIQQRLAQLRARIPEYEGVQELSSTLEKTWTDIHTLEADLQRLRAQTNVSRQRTQSIQDTGLRLAPRETQRFTPREWLFAQNPIARAMNIWGSRHPRVWTLRNFNGASPWSEWNPDALMRISGPQANVRVTADVKSSIDLQQTQWEVAFAGTAKPVWTSFGKALVRGVRELVVDLPFMKLEQPLPLTTLRQQWSHPMAVVPVLLRVAPRANAAPAAAMAMHLFKKTSPHVSDPLDYARNEIPQEWIPLWAKQTPEDRSSPSTPHLDDRGLQDLERQLRDTHLPGEWADSIDGVLVQRYGWLGLKRDEAETLVRYVEHLDGKTLANQNVRYALFTIGLFLLTLFMISTVTGLGPQLLSALIAGQSSWAIILNSIQNYTTLWEKIASSQLLIMLISGFLLNLYYNFSRLFVTGKWAIIDKYYKMSGIQRKLAQFQTLTKEVDPNRAGFDPIKLISSLKENQTIAPTGEFQVNLERFAAGIMGRVAEWMQNEPLDSPAAQYWSYALREYARRPLVPENNDLLSRNPLQFPQPELLEKLDIYEKTALRTWAIESTQRHPLPALMALLSHDLIGLAHLNGAQKDQWSMPQISHAGHVRAVLTELQARLPTLAPAVHSHYQEYSRYTKMFQLIHLLDGVFQGSPAPPHVRELFAKHMLPFLETKNPDGSPHFESLAYDWYVLGQWNPQIAENQADPAPVAAFKKNIRDAIARDTTRIAMAWIGARRLSKSAPESYHALLNQLKTSGSDLTEIDYLYETAPLLDADKKFKTTNADLLTAHTVGTALIEDLAAAAGKNPLFGNRDILIDPALEINHRQAIMDMRMMTRLVSGNAYIVSILDKLDIFIREVVNRLGTRVQGDEKHRIKPLTRAQSLVFLARAAAARPGSILLPSVEPTNWAFFSDPAKTDSGLHLVVAPNAFLVYPALAFAFNHSFDDEKRALWTTLSPDLLKYYQRRLDEIEPLTRTMNLQTDVFDQWDNRIDRLVPHPQQDDTYNTIFTLAPDARRPSTSHGQARALKTGA